MIRLAREEDTAAVSALVDAAYALYVPRIGRKPMPMLEDYAALIAEGTVHVLEQGPTIAGLVVLVSEDDAMLLLNIAVHPDAQGRGMGRVLLNFAESKAVADGYDIIRLYTNELMFENLDMYKHCGYAETDRIEEQGFRRVYMMKRLRPALTAS